MTGPEHRETPRTPLSAFSRGLVTGFLLSLLVAAVFTFQTYRREIGQALIRLGERLEQSATGQHTASPIEPDAVQKALTLAVQHLEAGKIAFAVPSEMAQGETRIVQVLIKPNGGQAILDGISDAARQEFKVENINVAATMAVFLACDGKNFEITKRVPIGEDEQPVAPDVATPWEWSVRALESGPKQELYFSVAVKLRLATGEEVERFSPAYSREISVRADRWFEVKQFTSTYWQWVISVLLIPIAGGIWGVWKNRNRFKPTPLSP
jgi:hypothetical protein